jgi:hypothetical protein
MRAICRLSALTLLMTAPAIAQEPRRARVFTASELPRLARGVAVPPGEWSVKVWAPTRDAWVLAADGASGRLSHQDEGDDPRPTWRELGTVQVGEGSTLKLVVEGWDPADPAKAPVVPPIVALAPETAFDPGPVLDVIRGRLDSAEPPNDPRRTIVRTNQQGADFHAPDSPRAWRDRAEAVRQQMLVALGLWPMPERTPLSPRVFGKLERDGYTIEKVVLETLPGFYLGGNLYRPADARGRVPAVLCPHGHWEDGRVNPEVQQRCIRWAKLGCVVFMYDMVGYNDSKDFGHKFLNPRLDRWGYSLAALQTWNSLRALDWLGSLPDVDPARIGCTGESGGGTQTFLLTALDPRVKAAAPVVMVSDSFQGGCACENAAGLRHGTDNVEFAALCAPRPMKLVGATGDWTKETMNRAYPAIRGVYELIGRPRDVAAEVFDFPHNYNQTSRNAVYAFLAPRLLGPIDPDSTREGEQTPEQPGMLRVFDEEHPAPDDARSAAQLEKDLITGLARRIDRLAPGADAAGWQAARNFLATSLRVRVGVEVPAPGDLATREVRRSSREGLTIVHLTVGRSTTGEQIPVVRLVPARASGRVSVLFNPHGKSALVGPDGQPAPLVRELLQRGQEVVGFDPFLVGESADPDHFTTRRPDVVHYECYNKALAADRLQDLATVVAWAASHAEARQVNLVGQGRWGVLALLARPALHGIGRTAIDLHDFDYGDGSDAPDDLHLPGVLQFGGPAMAAALCAPGPLWIARADDAFRAEWPARAYELAGARSLLTVDDDRPDIEALAAWLADGE